MERGDVSGSIGSMAIGKYQIFASLGRGGMADVFLAVARGPMGFNKLTVIKRLRPDHATDPSFANMLLDEARLAARLSHPNVVHTYEVGEEKGVYFIAMEYLEGQPLVRIARAASRSSELLGPPLCARVVADALAGLHYAHELRDYDGTSLKIIHRDVSPHNIFVTYDGSVKLMDFGIAKAASSATQTEVGVLKGKLAYMAPEQVSGEGIDRRADIFAMGIVLWELLTGERLFHSGAAAATLHKLLTQPIPRVSSKVPGIDPRLDDAVAKALEKSPANRFQTALEMRNALEEYISRSGTNPRQEDIGRRVSEIFEETRQNVYRQIQVHMAQVNQATNTGELAALNVEALRRGAGALEPTPSGRKLLSLDSRDSGSGSEVVPAASPPSLSGETQPKKKRGGAIVFGAGIVALIVAGIAFARLRPHGAPPAEPAAATAAPPPRETEPPSPPPAAPLPPAPVVAAPAAPVEAAPVVASSAAPSPAPPRREHPLPRTAPAPAAPAPKPAPPPPPAAVADVGTGFLTLDTYPWTRVTEGGRLLGVTPLVHVPLSAGTHVLTLENPDQGLKQQYTVTVNANESVSRRLGLK